MLATSGVSEVQVKVAGTVLPLTSRSVAKSWSSKPTGNAGSVELRPLNDSELPTGVGLSGLHAPKLDAPSAHSPDELRCREFPIGEDVDSLAPMSTDVMPDAGPEVAVSTPSYERNSSTVPSLLTRATPSGEPFWMPFAG